MALSETKPPVNYRGRMADYTILDAAKHELKGIWKYTATEWSIEQADKYHNLLEKCCERISEGSAYQRPVPNSTDVFVHRCEHHYILFTKRQGAVVILAFLHERMDLGQRLERILARMV